MDENTKSILSKSQIEVQWVLFQQERAEIQYIG
jgi:hypothetical protein